MIISHCTHRFFIGKYQENHDEAMDSELAAIAAIAYLHPEKLLSLAFL